MNIFQDFNFSNESYWRSIILFGNNVARNKKLGHKIVAFDDSTELATLASEMIGQSVKHLKIEK